MKCICITRESWCIKIVLYDHKHHIGIFKMYSRWILHIFITHKESEIGWESTWIVHEIKDEDLLANCI